jgi:hypothetical protein
MGGACSTYGRVRNRISVLVRETGKIYLLGKSKLHGIFIRFICPLNITENDNEL